MTTVLAWKTYREQRLVWLAFAALAVGIHFLYEATLAQDLIMRGALMIFLGPIAFVYGVVVGAPLLAGEREEGTAAFLEMLPASRKVVWQVKCGASGVLILSQVLFLWMILLLPVMWVIPVQEFFKAVVLLAILAGLGLLGFAWGLYFSGWTRTALGAFLGGVLGQAAVVPLLWGLLVVKDQLPPPWNSIPDPLPILAICAFLGELLLFVSWRRQA